MAPAVMARNMPRFTIRALIRLDLGAPREGGVGREGERGQVDMSSMTRRHG